MASYFEIPVTLSPDQRFVVNLNGTQCAFRLAFNTITGRWGLDLDIDGVPQLRGQRVIEGADLIGRLKLGLGRLVLAKWTKAASASPGLAELSSGAFRLVHILD